VPEMYLLLFVYVCVYMYVCVMFVRAVFACTIYVVTSCHCFISRNKPRYGVYIPHTK